MSKKAIILVVLALASLLAGMIGQYYWPGAPFSAADAVYALVGAFLIFAWYHIDAGQRGYRRSIWLNAGVILLAIVAVPYYFFRSRGFKSGLVWTGLFLLLLAVTSLLTKAGQYITYYWLRG